MTGRQAEQAVLEENKNKLQCHMHIQIKGMMVEVGLGEGMAEQIQALPFAKVIEYKRGKAFLCV